MLSNKQTTYIGKTDEILNLNADRCGERTIGLSILPFASSKRDIRISDKKKYEEVKEIIKSRIEEMEDFFPDDIGCVGMSAYIINGAMFVGFSSVRDFASAFKEIGIGGKTGIPGAYISRLFGAGKIGGKSDKRMVVFQEKDEADAFIRGLLSCSFLIPLYPDFQNNKEEDLLGYSSSAQVEGEISWRGGSVKYTSQLGEEKIFVTTYSAPTKMESYPFSPGLLDLTTYKMFGIGNRKSDGILASIQDSRILPQKNVLIWKGTPHFNVHPEFKTWSMTRPEHSLDCAFFDFSSESRPGSMTDYAKIQLDTIKMACQGTSLAVRASRSPGPLEYKF